MDGVERSEELEELNRCVDSLVDHLERVEGMVDQIERSLDRINYFIDWLQEAIPFIESEVESIRAPIQGESGRRETRRVRIRRVPIQRETEGVLQRVITESIETHKNRPRPTCPRFIEEQIQKVETSNAPEGYCSICLDDFQAEMEECVVIIPCSHVYHKACIMRWLEENNICPVCRFAFPLKRIRVQ